MRLGAHVSIAGGVDNAVERQRDYGGNCGQIFSHSPRVWQQPAIDQDEAERFREAIQSHSVGPWVIHSAYLVNLCSPNQELREKSVASLQADLDAASQLGIEYVNTHLGAHTGAGNDAGLANGVASLNTLDVPDDVRLLIETDAGAGTKLGGKFEHLAKVVEESSHDLGVCLDTAHIFVAGYDLRTPRAVEATLDEFKASVGLDRLECIHLNDSKHACGTQKDEHAHIGDGTIGAAGLEAIVNHPELQEVPFILETPTEDGKSFAWNIRRVRELRGGKRE